MPWLEAMLGFIPTKNPFQFATILFSLLTIAILVCVGIEANKIADEQATARRLAYIQSEKYKNGEMWDAIVAKDIEIVQDSNQMLLAILDSATTRPTVLTEKAATIGYLKSDVPRELEETRQSEKENTRSQRSILDSEAETAGDVAEAGERSRTQLWFVACLLPAAAMCGVVAAAAYRSWSKEHIKHHHGSESEK